MPYTIRLVDNNETQSADDPESVADIIISEESLKRTRDRLIAQIESMQAGETLNLHNGTRITFSSGQ